MTNENNRRIKSVKYVITILTLLFTLVSTFVFATSNEILPTNDVTPPRGKLKIVRSYTKQWYKLREFK